MNNNGIITYKENFISKIRKFLVKFFGLKTKNAEDTIVKPEIKEPVTNVEVEQTFLNDIKIPSNYINPEYKKKKFLEEIDGNLEALEMLSVDRLKTLEKYYDDVIKQNNNTIKKMKASN